LTKKPRKSVDKTQKIAQRLIAKDFLHIQSDISFFFQSFQDILILREAFGFSKKINPKGEAIF
jgi:hypothetical protein